MALRQITRNDLKRLTEEIDSFTGCQSFHTDRLDEWISDCDGDLRKTLLDLLGGYLHGLTLENSEKIIAPFIFQEHITEMPLHIVKREGSPDWKTIAARWRLSISR